MRFPLQDILITSLGNNKKCLIAFLGTNKNVY